MKSASPTTALELADVTPMLDVEKAGHPIASWWGRRQHFVALTKPRLSMMSVLTAGFGLLAAAGAVPDAPLSLGLVTLTILGSALAAGGAASLNMALEHRQDALMKRTRDRPTATGIIAPKEAFIVGIVLAAAGVALLTYGATLTAGLLAIATVGLYAAIYTPLKQKSLWATEIGAVAGALPPLIGWAAVEGAPFWLGGYLFGILFFWQIPHFMAISWLYRDDYQRGGFTMLAIKDATGNKVSKVAWYYAISLVALAPLPTYLGAGSLWFGFLAFFVSANMARHAWAFRQREERRPAGRKLFMTSLITLPMLLGSLVLDQWMRS